MDGITKCRLTTYKGGAAETVSQQWLARQGMLVGGRDFVRYSAQRMRFVNSVSAALALLVAAFPLPAQTMGQNTGPEGGAAAGTDAGARITGTRSPWGSPATTNSSGGVADPSRAGFIRGNVLFADGTSPEESVRIERVCGGSVHIEAHADSKGNFYIRLGGDVASNIADADPADNGLGTARSATAEGMNESANLLDCELRAAYPGYSSDSIDLSTHGAGGSANVGTLMLHRLANVRGTTISATTALAPKSARKSFAKGYQLWQKGKFAQSEEMFKAATADDEKFAIAWFALGRVQQRLKKPEDAVNSYLKAIAADGRYVSPYNQMAFLSGELGRWQDAVKYSQEAIELNPVELPSSFWYNAVANYNLKNDAEAEKSARALVKLDAAHKFPQVETMLAEMAESRGDLSEAALHLRTFLAEAPNAPNAGVVKQSLKRVEALGSRQAQIH